MTPFNAVLSLLLSLLLALTNQDLVAVNAQDDRDYTCNFLQDYRSSNKCETIGDRVCDDPNLGGRGGEDCRNQDCIDCNKFCKKKIAMVDELIDKLIISICIVLSHL